MRRLFWFLLGLLILIIVVMHSGGNDGRQHSVPQPRQETRAPPSKQEEPKFDGQAIWDANLDKVVQVKVPHPTKAFWVNIGTGFFVSETGDGSCQIATDAHVFTGTPAVTKTAKDGSTQAMIVSTATITLPRSGQKLTAVLELLDVANDLAIVRVDHVQNAKNVCKVPPIYDGPRYKGDRVVLLGVDPSTGKYRGSWGSITYRTTAGRDIDYMLPGENPDHTVVSMDIYAYHGDSGGPIFNPKQQVILVTVASDNKRVGSGTPVSYLLQDLERLKKSGRSTDGTYIYVWQP